MSMSDVVRVMREVHTLPSSAKLVLAAIADDTSESNGMSWPGVEKIATWADTSERQTLRIIADLEAGGWLERVEKAHRGRRATFRITLDRGLERVSSTSEERVSSSADRVSSTVERVSSTARKGDIAVSPLSVVNSPYELSVETLRTVPPSTDVATLDPIGEAFERIWKLWPHHRSGRPKAMIAFRRALKAGVSVELVEAAVLRDCAVWDRWPKSEHQYVPHLTTWLNDSRWDADPPADRYSKPTTRDDIGAALADLRSRRSDPQEGIDR